VESEKTGRSGDLENDRKHDLEPYWQDEKDWLCTVEFLPADDSEAGLLGPNRSLISNNYKPSCAVLSCLLVGRAEQGFAVARDYNAEGIARSAVRGVV
jgi:hypothetical protein